ncbi:MAG TPA: hypothetical protein VL181_09210 [Holophagaceae bacterium]|jgi:hypothetical protein|nr:hypothetical protein [Holophagaceae bacterium]
MPPKLPHPILDLLGRSARFLYLLWGGMFLLSMSLYGRLRLPGLLWRCPGLTRFLLGPWGKGLALGLGLVMATAALVEIWELVDRLLGKFLEHEDR